MGPGNKGSMPGKPNPAGRDPTRRAATQPGETRLTRQDATQPGGTQPDGALSDGTRLNPAGYDPTQRDTDSNGFYQRSKALTRTSLSHLISVLVRDSFC